MTVIEKIIIMEPSNRLKSKVEEVIELAQFIQGSGKYVITDFESLQLSALIYQADTIEYELTAIRSELKEIDSSLTNIASFIEDQSA